MKAKSLAIVILQHNTPHHVSNNLQKLKQAILPDQTEIVVVDNGGKNANKEIPKESYQGLNVAFYDMPNLGFPKGNNFGFSKLKKPIDQYDFIAFINPDIQVETDTIQKLIQYLEANPQVGLASPTLYYADGTVQDNYRVFPKIIDLIIKRVPTLRKRFPNRMREYLMWDRNTKTNEPVDWVTGAFTIHPTKAFQAIQKHDDRFFLFMSDVVLCRDTWEQGYEVHMVGEAEALHNDQRLSGGGITDVFKKKTLRIHIHDSYLYFKKYFFKAIPQNCPSKQRQEKREKIMKTKKLNSRPLNLTSLQNKLQKQNQVVDVYVGQVEGDNKYKQPVIFFNTGSIAVVKNTKNQFGLIKIWRHTPLQNNRKNTFPILPDLGDMGIYSLECVRGGVDSGNESSLTAAQRELQEEINLNQSQILHHQKLGTISADTGIYISKHDIYEFTVNDNFKPKKYDEKDGIIDFQFYNQEEIHKLISNQELICGLTQAALLQSIIKSNSTP